jgi:hypothetical protein
MNEFRTVPRPFERTCCPGRLQPKADVMPRHSPDHAGWRVYTAPTQPIVVADEVLGVERVDDSSSFLSVQEICWWRSSVVRF